MAKWDACNVSAATSAGAVVVTTAPAIFYGICASGSANATVINVHNGVTTAGAKVFMVSVPATDVSHDGPYVPIVCPSGIVTTNVGTLTTYVVLYNKLVVA
jgi:hypothetical protein